MSTSSNGTEHEDEAERRNRQLDQLLQEARVAMPGIQILFGFLLAVPFQQRFGDTTDFQRDVYVVALLAAAVATICFIAPASYHRILFERGEKERLIDLANRFLITGVGALAIAMSASVLLVCDLWFKGTTVTVVVATLVVAFSWFWFALPLMRRVALDRRER